MARSSNGYRISGLGLRRGRVVEQLTAPEDAEIAAWVAFAQADRARRGAATGQPAPSETAIDVSAPGSSAPKPVVVPSEEPQSAVATRPVNAPPIRRRRLRLRTGDPLVITPMMAASHGTAVPRQRYGGRSDLIEARQAWSSERRKIEAAQALERFAVRATFVLDHTTVSLDAATGSWPLEHQSHDAAYVGHRLEQFERLVEHFEWVEAPVSRVQTALRAALHKLVEHGAGEPLVTMIEQRIPFLAAGDEKRVELAVDAVAAIAMTIDAGGLEDFDLIGRGAAGTGLFEAVRVLHPPVIMDMFSVHREVLGELVGTGSFHATVLGASALVMLRNDVKQTPRYLLEMLRSGHLAMKTTDPGTKMAEDLADYLTRLLREAWWSSPTRDPRTVRR